MQVQRPSRRSNRAPDTLGSSGPADPAPPVDSADLADSADLRGGARPEPLEEFGGDPACWLARVCPNCGRITEGRDPVTCAACGEPLAGD